MADPGTSPPAPPRWPVWLSATLMVLGVATSVALALLRQDPLPLEVTEPVPGEVAAPPSVPFPDSAFSRLQDEIAGAKQPADRVRAALAMAEFLLGAAEWRPENERQLMAREYLLALAGMELDGWQRFVVVRHLFDLALALQDSESLARAEALLRSEAAGPEAIPFDLLCAEVDALLELGDPAMAYVRIEELGARAETASGSVPHLLRSARGLRLALEDTAALQAFWTLRKADGSKPDREAILAELAEQAAVLAVCGQTPLEAEGLWHQAYIARQRGETEAEAALLQQIVGKGLTPFRALAYLRLSDWLRDQGRDQELAVLLGRMIGRPELRKAGIAELQRRLRAPASTDVAQELLLAVNQVLEQGDELAQPLAQLLLAAGQMAVWQGWLPIAERYLDQAESLTLDRVLLADCMYLRAEIAQARGERSEMINAYKEVIDLHPGHPKEADIRFLLLQEMAAQPFSEADLVGGIIGAVTRLPGDSRGIRGLLMVAKRLEDLQLYELAETYYRLSVLLGTMQQVRDDGGSSAEALLGQARVMAAQGKDAEADALLRVINTNVRWSDIWSSSGPLWASLAFRQGQYREGVRRWRHTCGPPGGELMPALFGMLVPDLGDRSAAVDVATPRKPGRMPQDLVEAAIAAAMDQLLQRKDYEGVDRLMARVENDPDWGGKVSLEEYRMRALEGLAANESFARTADWVKRHPAKLAAADAPKESEMAGLNEWMQHVEAIQRRVRSLRP